MREKIKSFFIKLNTQFIFILLSMLILVPALYINFTLYSTYSGIKEIDSFSEGIMISDIMYNNHFINESLFLKAIHPELKFDDGSTGSKEEIYNKYINNETYKQDQYVTYFSNITAHRFIYNFIDDLFNSNKIIVIKLIKLINAIYLSIMLTIILLWIRKEVSLTVSISTLFILSFCCSNLIAFGTNLYWMAGSMFLPMVSSIIILNSKNFTLSKKYFNITFLVAFISCFLKQLLYFEFITTIMISMMIPYFYFAIKNKYNLKKCFKLFLFPVAGAISSFAFTCVIKIIMLNKNYSLKDAINLFFSPIIYRILGDSQSTSSLINKSTEYPVTQLINDMLSFEAISLKGIFKVTEGQLIIISAILIMITYFIFYKNKKVYNNKHIAFTLCTIISILAPFSWYILAKPHTFVHEWLCVILWYLPFNILLIALDVSIMVCLLRYILNKLIVNKCLNKKNIFVFILGICICLTSDYMSKDISAYKNLNMLDAMNDGVILYNNNNIEILYYNSNIYFITNKKITQTFFVHIIPEDLSNLDEVSKKNGFANYDFDFNANKVDEPYKINGKSIVKIELPNYLISKIITGQFEFKNNTYKNLWEDDIDLSKILLPKGYTFTPYDLSDSNWTRGISNDGKVILIAGNDNTFLGLKGKLITTTNGISTRITDVQFISEQWTYLILDESIIQVDNKLLSFNVVDK
ncbi:hypothetical protein [Anaerocolumna sp. MB42-C2]|uniref:hypothetical protein n=1 Tax=Anaerocolumna sp. MB42-C2 TaxID=3070997 RepID=UPI0027E206CF|nr:hypothetical protein [Anaerocolumna sp. MB42-C2]WMJ89800.1 hypothetical protein RBU59_09775 [Anaerocolumna sp. MB42-C2]